VTVSPSSGEGIRQEFSVSVAPANDLETAGLLMNKEPDGSQACYTLVDVTKPKYYLVKDPGSGSFPFAPETSAENSQCGVHVLYARLNALKNAFEFRVAADFKPAFAGDRVLFVTATDHAGHDSLQQAGSWMVVP
jgi:hypothetical protein